MPTLLTAELIERCHQGSRAKGFWDETPDTGQQLMLVVSELAESLEAHRKGRTCRLGPSSSVFSREMPQELFVNEFLAHVKDTVGDELADAYIRLCDFIGGFLIPADLVLREAGKDFILPANYGAALLEITGWVWAAAGSELNRDFYLGEALFSLEGLTEREAVPLAAHINAKLRYNATRPAKHGKSY